jgi:hypothetical protein
MTKKEPPDRDQPTGGVLHNGNTSSLGFGVSASDEDWMSLGEVLDSLGRQDGEFTAVCHKAVGGQFSSSVVESANITARIKSLPERSDVWFSVNPTAGPARVGRGRGGDREVSRWGALVLDVDVKQGAFPDLDKASEFINALSGMVGTRPSEVIHSGHGLQPLWPIEDGVLDSEKKWARACVLSRRFGRLASRGASNFSARLDTVSDLARIVRVPGTTNWKDPANPAPVYAVSDTGGPLTVDDIAQFVDEWAPEIASDAPVEGAVVSPPETWKFAGSTCAYVVAMVRSWGRASDEPKVGRHQWAMTRAVRLAAAHRLGCITAAGRDQALMILEAALHHWCQLTDPRRELAPDEVGSAYWWAEAKVATFSHLRAQSELGHHHRRSANARRSTLVPR